MAVSYSGFAQPTSGTAAAKAQARKARMEPGNRTVRAVYAGAEARSITAVTAPKELTIELNGRHEMVVVGTTLADLVTRTLPNARAYAVEVNRCVVPRRELSARPVSDGDRIEIVTLVGGG